MDSKILGSRIRQARERLGLSQEDLASLVSKDQGAISEYENGRRKISATDLPELAKALQVSLLHFYEGEFSNHDLHRAILEEFDRLPSFEAKQAMIEIVRKISDTIISLAPHKAP